MPQKNAINLSIRDLSSKKDPTKLKCLIEPDPVTNFDKSIKYLHKGVRYLLNEKIKTILKHNPYNFDDDAIDDFFTQLKTELRESGIQFLILFSLLIAQKDSDCDLSQYNSLKIKDDLIKLNLAIQLDMKHDHHEGTRGHGHGNECADFNIDEDSMDLQLKGRTPLEILEKANSAKKLFKNYGEQFICLSDDDDTMKCAPSYKIQDTPSKECSKLYLKGAQIIKCLHSIIDSAGQAADVGESPNDLDILMEIITHNFGELLFSSMFKSLVDNSIYSFTLLPDSKMTKDEWLEDTTKYDMEMVIIKDDNTYVVDKVSNVVAGQSSQFSVPEITTRNSRTLTDFLKASDDVFSASNIKNVWQELCKKWCGSTSPPVSPPVSITTAVTDIGKFAAEIGKFLEKENTDTEKTIKLNALVVIRDLQYAKKLSGDGCQNFGTLVYGNLKKIFKHTETSTSGVKKYEFSDNNLYKNITTETFDTFLSVVATVLQSSYSVGTVRKNFQYTMTGLYERFYSKNYFQVWQLSSTLLPLLTFARKFIPRVGGIAYNGSKNINKYTYINDDSDDSDESDINDGSVDNYNTKNINKFYNNLLLNNYSNKHSIMPMFGGIRVADHDSDKLMEQLQRICLLKLTYKDVIELNDDYWKGVASDETHLLKIVQFIFISKDNPFNNIFLKNIETLKKSLDDIVKYNQSIILLDITKRSDNRELSQNAEYISTNARLFNARVQGAKIPLLTKLWTGIHDSGEGFYYGIKEVCNEEAYSLSDEEFKKYEKKYTDNINGSFSTLNSLKYLKKADFKYDGINDLLKECFESLKLDANAMMGSLDKYQAFVEIHNGIVENLIQFLRSIVNKVKLFPIESNIIKKITTLLQFLFPIIVDIDDKKKCYSFTMKYPNLDISEESSYKELKTEWKCDSDGTSQDINLLNHVADATDNDDTKNAKIKGFLKDEKLKKFADKHNLFITLGYCNLVIRLRPISLLQKSILDQLTNFAEEESSDKSIALDPGEMVRTTLIAWSDEVPLDTGITHESLLERIDQKLTDLGSSEHKDFTEYLFDIFHKKKFQDNAYSKNLSADLSAKREHNNIMQRYLNKISFSLQKADELIEFVINSSKKIEILKQQNTDYEIPDEQIKELEDFSRDEKESLRTVLSKQKKAILKLILDIAPSNKKHKDDDANNEDRDIELQLAEEIKIYKNELEKRIGDHPLLSENKEEQKRLLKVIEESEDKVVEINKDITMEKKKKITKKGKKSPSLTEQEVENNNNIDKKITGLIAEKADLNNKILELREKYSDHYKKYEYEILILFLESKPDEEKQTYLEFLNKYIFSETINTTDDVRSNMFKYKDTYHSFNLGLKLDSSIFKEFSESSAPEYKDLSRILNKAFELKYDIFMRRQKIIKKFGTPEEDQPEEDQPEEDQPEEDQPVEEKEELDIFKELISHELSTLKALHLLSDFVAKINKNRRKSQAPSIKEGNEEKIKKKYLDKYPILKYLVTEYEYTDKNMGINQEIVDNLYVREEMLIILYRILNIPERCEKLEKKLPKIN